MKEAAALAFAAVLLSRPQIGSPGLGAPVANANHEAARN
jgi:hypothetical protein